MDYMTMDYSKAEMFMHCKFCLNQYNVTDVKYEYSPHEWLNYEASDYPYEYPDGTKARIIVVWCKRCKQKVWDSRHLKPIEDEEKETKDNWKTQE
jgi:hypothetical protein